MPNSDQKNTQTRHTTMRAKPTIYFVARARALFFSLSLFVRRPEPYSYTKYNTLSTHTITKHPPPFRTLADPLANDKQPSKVDALLDDQLIERPVHAVRRDNQQSEITPATAAAAYAASPSRSTIEHVLDEFERELDMSTPIESTGGVQQPGTLSHLTQTFIDNESSANRPSVAESPSPPIVSRIPVSATKTSTPIKVKTIKKHSKVNRDLAKQSTAATRPTVGDIEWKSIIDASASTTANTDDDDGKCEEVPAMTDHRPTQQITEISTLNLEDVTSPFEHQSFEPVVILSPSDDYSGEIDEVILVQTLGDDYGYDDDDDDDRRACDLEMERCDDDDDGAVATARRMGDDCRRVTTVPGTVSADDLQTTPSLSINSESDSDSRVESPYQLRRNILMDLARSDTDAARAAEATASLTAGGSGCEKTMGSSSGSDVALHEAGAELSDDEPGKFFVVVSFFNALSMSLYLCFPHLYIFALLFV